MRSKSLLVGLVMLLGYLLFGKYQQLNEHQQTTRQAIGQLREASVLLDEQAEMNLLSFKALLYDSIKQDRLGFILDLLQQCGSSIDAQNGKINKLLVALNDREVGELVDSRVEAIISAQIAEIQILQSKTAAAFLEKHDILNIPKRSIDNRVNSMFDKAITEIIAAHQTIRSCSNTECLINQLQLLRAQWVLLRFNLTSDLTSMFCIRRPIFAE